MGFDRNSLGCLIAGKGVGKFFCRAEDLKFVEDTDAKAHSENHDGGPGSGNFGHKGVPGQIGGSAPSGNSIMDSSSFKKGDGVFELSGDVKDMYLTETARARIEGAIKKVKTASDLKEYLSERGIELETSYEPLQKAMDREIPSVKQQVDYVIAAVEQYDDLGGLSALKAVHIYEADLDAQCQYSYRATGEGEVKDEGHLYISDIADGFQIMHEFAHAYADSTKPEGMDVVEWSAKLNTAAGLSKKSGAYFGAKSDVREAERFADAIGHAITSGKNERLEFLANVSNIVRNGRLSDDGGPGSGNFGHEGRPGEIGGSAPSDGTPASNEAAQAESRVLLKITKRRFNDKVKELFESVGKGDGEPQKKEIEDMLDGLAPGSVIQYPNTYWHLTKRNDGNWVDKDGFPWKPSSISNDFLCEDEYRPTLVKSAMTADAIEADMRRAEQSYWRNNKQFWNNSGSFSEKSSIKLRKLDLDHAGEGTVVTASDGTRYEKIGGTWYEEETGKQADKRKLGSPTFTGDFFETNFGLNGVTAEECRNMREVYDGMPESLKKKYEEVFQTCKFSPAMSGTSHYNQYSNEIFFNDDDSAEVVLHECAHAFDEGSIDKEVDIPVVGGKIRITSASVYIDHLMSGKMIRDDFESMAKEIGIETNGNGWFVDEQDMLKNVDAYISWAVSQSNIDDFDCVSDAISGLTMNSLSETIFGGHDASYWMRPFGGKNASSQSTEYWANFLTLKSKRNTTALELLKKVSPNRYQAALETYKEAFGDD